MLRELLPDEDFIQQGDRPRASAIVVEGLLARYHMLASGKRQYLSLHLPGDWPDAQGLFLEEMDHSVCAIGRAVVCVIPHESFSERADSTASLGVKEETLDGSKLWSSGGPETYRTLPSPLVTRMNRSLCSGE